jgi:hypothetical protein
VGGRRARVCRRARVLSLRGSLRSWILDGRMHALPICLPATTILLEVACYLSLHCCRSPPVRLKL